MFITFNAMSMQCVAERLISLLQAHFECRLKTGFKNSSSILLASTFYIYTSQNLNYFILFHINFPLCIILMSRSVKYKTSSYALEYQASIGFISFVCFCFCMYHQKKIRVTEFGASKILQQLDT